jgi:outer membrane protein
MVSRRFSRLRALLGTLALASPLVAGSAGAQVVYDLDACIDMALGRSQNVAIAENNLDGAHKDVLAAYGSFLPQLSTSFYAGHTFIGPTGSVSIDSEGRPIEPTGFDYESYSFSLNASMPIFQGGNNIFNLSRRKEEVRRFEADLEYARYQTAAEVIRSYYGLVLQTNLLEVTEEGVQAAQRNLERAETFYRLGSSARVDVLSAKVRLSNAELERIRAENALQLARVELAKLIQVDPDAGWDVDMALEAEPEVPEVQASIEYAMRNRADLKSWEHRVRSAQHGVRQARSGKIPSLNARFFYGWSDRFFFDQPTDVFDSEYNWGVGVSLSYNIFDGFQTKSAVGRAKASRALSEHSLRLARDDAALEIRQIILNMKEALARVENSEETVEQAAEELRLAEERYQVGAGTILEVNDAQVNLTDAKANVVRAQCDYLTYRADLARATGRKELLR